MNFNLIDEQWIPVLYHDGRWERVGVRKALEDAGRIRQIATSNAMDRLAIFRFLLALLYWCKGNPPDASNATSRDSFPEDWFSKLDAFRDRFNLLGDGSRFYQDDTARRRRTTTDLIQEIPTGNNFWHFRHSTDEKNGLCPACCTTGLLRLPLFSVSGLPDLKAGINGTPPIYVVPWTTSLQETLFANWLPCQSIGEPVWSQPDVRPTPGEDVPFLTGMTLLSRRVWLHDPVGPPGLCMGCGIKEPMLIRTCEFQSAGKQQNDLWNDPHVVYSNKTPRNSERAKDLTAAGKFRMDRPWPDLLSRLVEAGKFGPGEKSISLLVVGFATDQAKNIDVWERTITVPPGTARQSISALFPQKWLKEGSRMEKRVGRSKHEGAALIASIRPHVEDSVSARAGELFVANDEAWEQAAVEYRPMLGVIAKSLSPGFTTTAFQRRRQISYAVPDMRPRSKPAQKLRPKKGGGE